MTRHAAASLNLSSIIEHHAAQTPDRPAVVLDDRRFTYGQLNALACQVANGLVALGIQPGDHVALACPNLPFFPVVYFGILKAGAVVVPLNVLFKPREIAYHLRDSDARALFVFEGTPELAMARMAREACDEVPGCAELVVMTADPAAPAPVERARTIWQLIAGQPDRFETCPTRPDDTAVILYTSGTSGQPKGAELTHFNIWMNGAVSRDLMAPMIDARLDGTNVALITLPLFHSTGQVAQMVASLIGGFAITLVPRFDPATVLKVIDRDRANFWIGVPTMYWALLQHVRANGLDPSPFRKHLRLCMSGGAPMPVAVMQDFERMFGVRVLEGYGLSETSPVAAFNHLTRPSKPGTVGQPLHGVEIRCVDDRDRPVPVGEPGEVVVRGHNVMKGYYKRPEATEEAMRNGWFHTGDIGMLDAEGYLSIVDRKKDLILRGGMNVYPRELEEVLLTHPAVSLAAVIGVPDDRLGEEILAVVVRKPDASLTEAELLAWCKEQFAAYKYPRRIEFRDRLPIGATGKILKRELRAEHT
jgi:long-chain acyl-CoA synthetase